MTHAELVRTTAENLRLICDRLGYSVKNMDMFTSIARVAVAMKAEGFDEGVNAADKATNDFLNYSGIRQRKQDLGLTKPTDNEQ